MIIDPYMALKWQNCFSVMFWSCFCYEWKKLIFFMLVHVLYTGLLSAWQISDKKKIKLSQKIDFHHFLNVQWFASYLWTCPTPIVKNICKRLLLEVFYKKAAVKNFAIFTGQKLIAICVMWKRCSWWLIELWKWHVFILINISCKSGLLNGLFFSFRIIWGIFFGPEFFWLRAMLREPRILNCHCWGMLCVLSKF